MSRTGNAVSSDSSGGAAAEGEKNIGLSPEKLDLLRLDLSQLKPDVSTFPARALKFVVDGEDDIVLSELAQSPNAARQLRLLCFGEHMNPNDFRSRFFATVEPQNPATYLRLARLYAGAAIGCPGVTHRLPPAFAQIRWLEIFVEEATKASRSSWPPRANDTGLTCALLEELLVADGEDPQLLLRAILEEPTKTFGLLSFGQLALHLADICEYLAKQAKQLVPLLMKSSAKKDRIYLLELLTQSKVAPTPFVEGIVHCGVDSAKTVRQAAEPMLHALGTEAEPVLREFAVNGETNDRIHAVRLLGAAASAGTSKFLAERREIEKSAKVRQAIDDALRNLSQASAVTAPVATTEEPVPTVELDGPVTPALEAELRNVLETFNEQQTANNAKRAAQFAQGSQGNQIPARPTYSAQEIDELCRQFREGRRDLPLADCWTKWTEAFCYRCEESTRLLRPVIEHRDLKPIPLIRLMILLGSLPIRRHDGHVRVAFMFDAHEILEAYRSTHSPAIGLTDLANALEAAGLPADTIAFDMLESQWTFDWEPEAIRPYFASRLGLLEQNLAPPSDRVEYWNWNYNTMESITRILSKFATVPPSLVGKFWEMAIGTNKTDRVRAQRVVKNLPDLQERLADTLQSGSFQTRTVAAQWLGRLGDKRAVAVLDTAARKEKQDAALDEILTALEKLGEPIEPYLDRQKLHADAEKGLKKGIPAALDWFPWNDLPRLHWSDTGNEIPTAVVKWLIVQNFKLKSAEAGPLLRRYCELIVPAEREAFGRFMLSSWLAQDLIRKYSDAEARALARQNAPAAWQQTQQIVQWCQQNNETPPAILPKSIQQEEEIHYESFRRECGSAVAEKGILAVAGACGGSDLVGPVQSYLKEWYGYRAAQCKALIAMLSAVDRPAAIQYVLSIANRFRTKGIREEAEKYVRLLAERKGWTLDELADRTMPTAGFDDDGTLELNYGPRVFTARVNSDLDAVLVDAAGKVLKNLPDPRQDDDAELANAAKATFSASKKELKKFAGMQATRLYEAMCTERAWPAADWRTYLFGHPLLKFLCQRLVWAVWKDNAIQQTFRPLDDGTLTDYEDGAVTVAEDATIRIAHGCQLSEAVAESWQKHLLDYDVVPLFTQFGRAAYSLPEERRNATKIDDFQGYMVEAFKLRGLATKSGYTRGQAEDGGWFYEYTKRFPGLGLVANLRFSGNGLPEENRHVALTELSFQKSVSEEARFAMHGNGLPLGEIPTVLLTECYNDLASIANAGTGFDPDWEKKVEH